MTYKILVADDEAEIRELLRLYLENANYGVIEAEDGVRALELFGKKDISLCILDVMMPGMDGFHVLKKIREKSNVPVLMLSAKDQDADKILGLNLGADDYIAKPFNPLEAVARVNAAIRRFYALGASSGGETDEEQAGLGTISVRDLTLDRDACVLYRGGTPIELTSVEYRVMELFMMHPGKVFTKQQLYEHGWDEAYIASDNNIMVCISKLRAKLDPEETTRYIHTVRGLGYRLVKE